MKKAISLVAIAAVLLIFTSSQESWSLQNYDFLSEWGSYGISSGQFSQPRSIAVDADGNVYVTDLGNKRVQKFSSIGNFIGEWGSGGKQQGQFYHPSGIDVEGNHVYVVDRDLHRIQKFDLEGNFVSEWGGKGSADGKLLFPRGVTTTPDAVFVGDTGNQRIQKFTTDGEFVLSFGSSGLGKGQFINVVDINTDSQGNIYVTDKGNGKIEKFDESGNLLESFQFTAPDYVFAPTGIAIDRDGNMFAVNSNTAKILLLNQDDDTVLDKLEQLGPISEQFNTPTDVSIGVNGELYVVDSTAQKIKIFETPYYVEPLIPDFETPQTVSENSTKDKTKPQITAPSDIEVDATDLLTTVELGEPTAHDDESGIKTILNNAPDKFYPGFFTVHWIAFDNARNSAVAYQQVLVTTCGKVSSSFNKIQGTDGDDVLEGTDGDDLIFGMAGNDIIYGGDGDDCIFGGSGDDIIYSNNGSDIIRGNKGDDIIKGQQGNDSLYGDEGFNVVDGGEGDSDGCYDSGEFKNSITLNCEN